MAFLHMPAILMGNSKLLNMKAAQDAVHKCALFLQFPAEKVDHILSRSRLIDLEEGEFLVQQGDPATEFYLVLKGELKLATSSSVGQEKILHIIHPGQTFAEVLMFLGKPKFPASVEALIASQVLGFSSDLYKSFAERIDRCLFWLTGSICVA